jgi:uncharacterized protein with GYD domain
MATYISLLSFTEQGIRNVKESPARADAAKAMAAKMGVNFKSLYWTVGQYDLVAIVEGSDEAVTAFLLKTGSMGNIKTQTMRAYTADEFAKIVASVP